MLKTSLKPLTIAIHCAAASVLVYTAEAVQASEAGIDNTATTERISVYNIPAGNLSKALNHFAQQTGVFLVMDDAQLRQIETNGLQGRYNIAEGFSALLKGTGYRAKKTSAGFIIEDVNKGVMVIDPLRVESTVEARFGDAPAEPGGLKAKYQTTATKMALSLRETPQAISVVTRDSLDARQVKDLSTAVELTPGVSNSSNGFGTFAGPGAFAGLGEHEQKFVTRGQPADVRSDGFLTGSFGGGVDIAAYERIEVVKGASGFYGRGSLGGFINLVRKKPQADFAADISAQTGSFDTYRTEANITGALTDQKNLRGQLSTMYENSGAFVEDIKSERILVAPSIEWIVSNQTRVLFQTLYQKDKYDANPGTSLNLVGDQIKLFNNSFSSRRKLQGVTGEKSEIDTVQASITIDHELSDRWLASLILHHANRKQRFINNNYTYVYDGTVYSYALKDNWDRDSWAGELRLKGEFEAFSQTHKLLFGLEKNGQSRDREFGYAGGTDLGLVESFDGYFPASLSILEKDIPTTTVRDRVSKNKAVYGQLLLSVHERTKLLIGARYDSIYQRIKYAYDSTAFDQEESPNALTMRLGLTQTITANISAYAVYAESFTPVTTSGRNGLLDPETGEGYELGLKTDWFDNELGANLAVYRQELDNRPVPDPTNRPGTNDDFSISSGLHRSDGVELEITGSPYPGLTVAAAASWAENEFTELGDPNKGLSIDGSVDQQYSLYAHYELQAGALKGFGIGATLVSVDERQFIIDGEQAYLEGYERLDLNLSYNGFPNLDLSLLVRNITDEKYIDSANPILSNAAFFGSPRAALLTATYHFD